MNLENTRPSDKKHRPPDARDMKIVFLMSSKN